MSNSLQGLTGVLLIILSIIALFFVFKRLIRKGGFKPLFWWLFTSIFVSIVTNFVGGTAFASLKSSNGSDLLGMIISALMFVLSGFLGLLVVAIMNGIFFGKWRVKLSTPDED